MRKLLNFEGKQKKNTCGFLFLPPGGVPPASLNPQPCSQGRLPARSSSIGGFDVFPLGVRRPHKFLPNDNNVCFQGQRARLILVQKYQLKNMTSIYEHIPTGTCDMRVPLHFPAIKPDKPTHNNIRVNTVLLPRLFTPKTTCSVTLRVFLGTKGAFEEPAYLGESV